MARIVQELESALPTLTKAVFSQPTQKTSMQKLTVRPLLLRGERLWQSERQEDNKAFHQNLTDTALLACVRDELEGAFRQVLIQTETESRQYVLKRDGSYKKTGASAAVPRPGGAEAHDREKDYILREGEVIPALVDLGVFTKDYRIVHAKYDKFRQINRFVELVDQTMKKESADRIRILDFGCGKSYLTFILYWYFAVRRGMSTEIIGYDLKRDVVEHCRQVAARYGYDGLRFEVADVTHDTLTDTPIDMVVTLHACDTATDYALAYAIRRRVKNIFSVPCCQHEINGSIRKGGELDLLLEHGILKERVSALLTDAIRAAVLESEGYETDLIEFVDFEHSPKNLMIRAHYTGRRRPGGREKAEALRERYGFEQSLLALTEEGAQNRE
ncbi:MAG: SAM-dependent methyltransferase [Oscillospiraceae bacterium]|nr:SAM-dependent methyltransferase [Oscillospiraceae bacterium]